MYTIVMNAFKVYEYLTENAPANFTRTDRSNIANLPVYIMNGDKSEYYWLKRDISAELPLWLIREMECKVTTYYIEDKELAVYD
jgi:hypothetical protein